MTPITIALPTHQAITVAPCAGAPISVTPVQGAAITLGATPGIPGPPGPSAYLLAVKNGFVGTEAQWLASLSENVVIPEMPDFSLIFEGALL